MELFSWVLWGLSSIAAVIWAVVWFLVGGWVVTIAQLAVLIGIVFTYKYGWRRAPIEVAGRMRTLISHVWPWLRRREPRLEEEPTVAAAHPRPSRQFGDVNLSTLMSVVALLGIGALFVL